MKVGEVITAIEEKELSISDLAKQFGVSDRTIQKKIKELYFVWNSKERQYKYQGNEDIQSVYDIEISSLFRSNKTSKSNAAKESESENKRASKSTSCKTDSNLLVDAHSNMKEEVAASIDEIDLLMMGKKEKEKKYYRGFYFDPDVIEVIDRVESGSKSELVNAALRKVFKEKGLL